MFGLATALLLQNVMAADCEQGVSRDCIASEFESSVLRTADEHDLAIWVTAVEMRAAVGDYSGASAFLHDLRAPKDSVYLATARIIGASIYAAESGNDEAALRHARAIDNQPGYAWYLALLGRYFSRIGDLANAREIRAQLADLGSPLLSDLEEEVLLAELRTGRRAEGLMRAEALLAKLSPPVGSLHPRDLRRLAVALAKGGQPGMARDVYSLIGTTRANPALYPAAAVEAVIVAATGRFGEALELTNQVDDPAVRIETLIDVIDYMGMAGYNNEVMARLCRRVIGGLKANTNLASNERAALFERLFWAVPHGWVVPRRPDAVPARGEAEGAVSLVSSLQ
jgi:tetratricopeptide (TPR) repeat protein